jgi:glycosyltransferase involved in cell wall biosynthesis
VRVGFDAKRLYNNFTGLGNYSRFVVAALAEHFPSDDYFLFTPKVKINPETKPFLDHPKIKTILPPDWMSKLKLGSYWRSFQAGKAAGREGVQLYHGLSHEVPDSIPAGMKTVVTVHDLIFLRYPQFYNSVDVFIYKTKVMRACKKADRIVAISEQTAQDVINYLKVPESKIDVVFQGCHSNFKRKFSKEELEKIRVKYSLPENFILNVGTIEERKNAAAIVKAIGLLPENLRLPVVIVGKKTDYLNTIVQTAKASGVEKDLMFIHNAEFVDLPAIYQMAKVFVYPSLFEGFGIPLIEAIESGVPVISSRDSCFSEAAGPDAIYIDPHQPEELAIQLEKVLNDKQLAQQMVKSSSLYIEKFQSKPVAAAMFKVYNHVIGQI